MLTRFAGQQLPLVYTNLLVCQKDTCLFSNLASLSRMGESKHGAIHSAVFSIERKPVIRLGSIPRFLREQAALAVASAVPPVFR